MDLNTAKIEGEGMALPMTGEEKVSGLPNNDEDILGAINDTHLNNHERDESDMNIIAAVNETAIGHEQDIAGNNVQNVDEQQVDEMDIIAAINETGKGDIIYE